MNYCKSETGWAQGRFKWGGHRKADAELLRSALREQYKIGQKNDFFDQSRCNSSNYTT